MRRTCRSSTGGRVQRARRRQVEQLVVRHAAPEEERQARRQLQIADAIRRVRRKPRRIVFDAEQELRTDEHGRQRHLNPRLEVAVGARLAVERHRSGEIGRGDGTPVGAPHQRGQDLSGGAICIGGRGRSRTRDEDALAARRLARRGGAARRSQRSRKPRQ